MSQQNAGPKAFKAGAAVTRYRRVKLDGSGDVVHAGADEIGIGVALETKALGEHTPVRLWGQPGSVKLEALAAVAARAVVHCGAAGRIDDDAALGPAVGIALEAASAAGDIVEVLAFEDLTGDKLLFANVADSASVTNTVTETDFDKKKSLNGAMLRKGDVIEVMARAQVVAANATDTLTLRLKVGTEIIVATTAVDVAANDIGFIHAMIVVRDIGATGKLSASGVWHLGVPGTANDRPFRLDEATEDISGTFDIKVTAQWSVANAGNDVILEDMIVILHRQ